MTPAETAIVRDLQARLQIAWDELQALESAKRSQAERLRRRIVYLERDKASALERARKATDAARYWKGVVLARRSAA